MAINVKELLADALLQLCRTSPLETVTVRQLLEQTGVSRQTFYNHFRDKNDLIQYIYTTRMIPGFGEIPLEMDFEAALTDAFCRMEAHRDFLRQACRMDGQNCLKDFLFLHCREFDLAWHQKRYGSRPMPEALRFATEYHAMASTSMTLSWILSGMPVPAAEMARLITQLRSVGMETLFAGAEHPGDPYRFADGTHGA